ncbi:MAG TPA: hypothetical protein VM686_03475, partial [Polyangiaceae bacterium]|nr:hypothetical protein [Polyangiaceae bacterium]
PYSEFDLTLWKYPMVQISPDKDWLDIAASTFWCGIRGASLEAGGTLWCALPWYSATIRQAGSYSDWIRLDMSHGRMCGLRANGQIWCWGFKLVCSPTEWIGVPVWERIDSTSDFVSFSAGAGHTCGLKQDGSLWCAGAPDFSTALEPLAGMTEVAPGTRWREVVASWYFTCGVQEDGSLWCWGDNRYGQLGVGMPGNARPAPERVGDGNDWSGLAASYYGVACGLRGGQAWCWGQNYGGLVRQEYVASPPVTVLRSAEPAQKFCAWPEDYDSDGYAGCLGDCDDSSFSWHPEQVVCE